MKKIILLMMILMIPVVFGAYNLSDPASNKLRLSFTNSIVDISGNNVPIDTSFASSTYGLDKNDISNQAKFFNGSENIRANVSAITDEYTISFWINDTVNNDIIYDYRDATNDGVYIRTSDNTISCQHNEYAIRSASTITLNQWYHIVCIQNGTGLEIYINNVKENSTDTVGDLAVTNPITVLGSNFQYAGYFDNSFMDEFNIWNYALNESEIEQLYLGYDDYYYNPDVPGVSSNISDYTQRINSNFNINVSFVNILGDLVNCSAYDNNTDITCSDVTAGADNESTVTCSLNGGSFENETIEIIPYCYNSTDSYNATTGNVIIDNTLPSITLYSPNPANSSEYTNVTPVLINFTLEDLGGLYGYNISCNDGAYSVQNTTLTGTEINITQINVFNTVGQNNCSIEVADTHTDNIFNPKIKVNNKFLGLGEYSIVVNDNLKIKYDDSNSVLLDSISYEKLDDRISPIFNFKTPLIPKDIYVTYTIEYEGTARVIDSEYPGHIVICPDTDLNNCYWFDAADEDNTLSGYVLDEKNHRVVYTHLFKSDNTKDKLKTESLGGLNTYQLDFNFNIIPGISFTYDAYNIWNKSDMEFNVYFNDTLNATTSGITYNLTCQDLDIKINATGYANGYGTTGDVCSLPALTNNSFYQAILRVNTYSNGSTTLINDSIIYVNDSYANTSTAAAGTLLYYINNGTISYNASHPTHNDSIIGSTSIDFNSSNVVNITMNYNGTLTITVYDADTLAIITYENITIDMLNSVSGYTNSIHTDNDTGQVTVSPPAGTTLLTFSGDSYNENEYYYTLPLTFPATDTLSLYLTNTSSADNNVIFTVKDSVTSTLLEGVNFIISQNINSTWVNVANKTTDITGRVQFTFVEDAEYKFNLSNTGYVNKVFTLNPILFTSYTVKLTPSSTITDSIQNLGVYLDHTPKKFTLNDTGTINFTISSPGGLLDEYSLTVTYGSDSDTYTGTTATGEVLSHSYNLNNASIQYIIISYDYYSDLSGYKSFSYPYKINNVSSGNTIEALKNNAYGMGLFERMLLAILFALIVAGISSLVAGPVGGGALGLFVLTVFAYVGLIPWWSIYVSLIIGFILIIKGGNN